MEHDYTSRPDPDTLLRSLQREREKEGKGRLKIFLGMCAGVGKTYRMLEAAHVQRSKGISVKVGIVETHGRKETNALLAGFSIIPKKKITYRDTVLEEMDLDTILSENPELVLVDELAHTNAPGSRHARRYKDVEELLDHGIDVFTTLNVQHLESSADAVAQITGAIVRETVPDSILERADDVEVVDLSPDELLIRLAEGKVYAPERSRLAVDNFFKKGNLTALREMMLRLAAERVDYQLREYMQSNRIVGPWKAGERLIMGISSNPYSVPLIRWARRMAFTLRASWIVVYVEPMEPLNDTATEQLQKNISLARELGAEIITTVGSDIADALLRVAKEQNATQILVGKPGQRSIFRKNILRRLLANSGDLDIHVFGSGQSTPTATLRLGLPYVHSPASQYLLTLLIIALTAAVCYLMHQSIGYQTVAMILLLVVSFLPLRFGVGPVLLAAGVSALVWNFFFIPPQFTFYIATLQDALMFIAYFIIAAVTSVLIVRIRSRERALHIREQRSSALYALTNDLSIAHSTDDVAQAAVINIKKFFASEVAIFPSELDGDFLGKPHAASTFLIDQKELSVPNWVHWNEKRAGRYTDTLPFASATYYPIIGPRYPLGVIGIHSYAQRRLSIEQEALLENFIRQIGLALDREFLNEMTKRSVVIAESERLYSTLFNSISHEMRTPITVILSTAEHLLNEAISQSPEVRRTLAGEILSASQRLDAIVQDLLAMTRLESGLIKPALDWCDAADVIDSALARLATETARHSVCVDIQPALPLVKLDFALVEQALVNLLRNATQYAPHGTAISISAAANDKAFTIMVEDEGPGFPDDAMKHLFEKFYRVPGSFSGGIGLGLAIVRGFVEAHKGSVVASNRIGGGAHFIITLPLEAA